MSSAVNRKPFRRMETEDARKKQVAEEKEKIEEFRAEQAKEEVRLAASKKRRSGNVKRRRSAFAKTRGE